MSSGTDLCFRSVSKETADNLLKSSNAKVDFSEIEATDEFGLDIEVEVISFLFTDEMFQSEDEGDESVFLEEGTHISIDVGVYGIIVQSPEQVINQHEVFKSMPVKTLKKRFKSDDFQETEIYADYLEQWANENEDEDEESDELQFISENYKNLVSFYKNASKRGDAVIYWYV